jgi:hypothetical protein
MRRIEILIRRAERQRTFPWQNKKFRNWNRERAGKSIQDIHGWVFLLSLHASKVRSVDASIEGQPLLRKAALYPDPRDLGLPGRVLVALFLLASFLPTPQIRVALLHLARRVSQMPLVARPIGPSVSAHRWRRRFNRPNVRPVRRRQAVE